MLILVQELSSNAKHKLLINFLVNNKTFRKKF